MSYASSAPIWLHIFGHDGDSVKRDRIFCRNLKSTKRIGPNIKVAIARIPKSWRGLSFLSLRSDSIKGSSTNKWDNCLIAEDIKDPTRLSHNRLIIHMAVLIAKPVQQRRDLGRIIAKVRINLREAFLESIKLFLKAGNDRINRAKLIVPKFLNGLTGKDQRCHVTSAQIIDDISASRVVR